MTAEAKAGPSTRASAPQVRERGSGGPNAGIGRGSPTHWSARMTVEAKAPASTGASAPEGA